MKHLPTFESFIGSINESADYSKENLDVETYRNGDPIPEVQDAKAWGKLTTGAWCYYDNDPANGKKYGKLYNWNAVNDPRGLAPNGYRIPTDKEMKSFKKNIKNEDLYGGYRNSSGYDNNIGDDGSWWSSSENNASDAWYLYLSSDNDDVSIHELGKRAGLSVRCLKGM